MIIQYVYNMKLCDTKIQEAIVKEHLTSQLQTICRKWESGVAKPICAKIFIINLNNVTIEEIV
uniref:Uncharacterized protein n=1 Tax=Rhizophagus irregularis (strain DAOM 181602 / DAOM 197198 / MUCL 43194) TaxID=747089 RepID=U9USV5_RHIID